MQHRSDIALAFGSVRGPERLNNEDDFLAYEPSDDASFERIGRLFAVADGVGGGPAGGEASRLALRNLLAGFLESVESEGREALDQEDLLAALQRGAARANEAIAEEVARKPFQRGMATTLTAISLRNGQVTGIQAGDTCCFLVHDGKVRALSELHQSAGSESQVTRAIGAGGRNEQVDGFEGEVAPGDSLLLATDGLYRALGEERLATFQGRRCSEEVAEWIVEAEERSGRDNATLLALHVAGGPGNSRVLVEPIDAEPLAQLHMPSEGARRFHRIWPWILLVASALLLVYAWRGTFSLI